MALREVMYEPREDSLSSFLVGDISSTDTLMTVANAAILSSVIPPYPLTLGIDKMLTETVLVTAQNLDNNQLTVERSHGYIWPSGTKVARVFTIQDYRAFMTNISDLDTRTEDLEQNFETTEADQVLVSMADFPKWVAKTRTQFKTWLALTASNIVDFATKVLSTVLSTLPSGENTAVKPTDTLETAIAKLQTQLMWRLNRVDPQAVGGFTLKNSDATSYPKIELYNSMVPEEGVLRYWRLASGALFELHFNPSDTAKLRITGTNGPVPFDYDVYHEGNIPSRDVLGTVAKGVLTSWAEIDNPNREPGIYTTTIEPYGLPEGPYLLIHSVNQATPGYATQLLISADPETPNISYTRKMIFVEGYVDPSWSNWVKNYNEDNPPSAAAVGASAKGALTTLEEVNLINREPGIYTVTGVDLGFVDDTSFLLIHSVDQSNSEYAMQIVMSADSGSLNVLASRKCIAANTWGDWIPISNWPRQLWGGSWNGTGSLTVSGLDKFRFAIIYGSNGLCSIVNLKVIPMNILTSYCNGFYQYHNTIALGISGNVLGTISSSTVQINMNTRTIGATAFGGNGAAFAGSNTISAIYGIE